MIVALEFQKYVINCVSERIFVIQINSTPVQQILIKHTHSIDKTDEEVKTFHQSFSKIIKELDKKYMTILAGDCNTKIEKGESGHGISNYCLGIRNESGVKLEIYVKVEGYVVLNINFQHGDSITGTRITWEV